MFQQTNTDRHSLQILNALYQYDDFMESIKTLVDLGCGSGQDLEWWATATTRDDSPQPLNIRCVGVDILDQLPIAKKYPNITYQRTDFETTVHPPRELFDVLWCHDAFQYCVDPLHTLTKWREIGSTGAMLVVSIPSSIHIHHKQVFSYLPAGVLYHHSIVSLIKMLSLSGWDCRSGFFKVCPQDLWTTAVVYKTDQVTLDPKTTTWYDLLDSNLLPESATASIKAHGYLRQQDLIVPWLDKGYTWLGKQ